MKRESGTSDEDWAEQLATRKLTAEQAMERADNMKGFVTLQGMMGAAKIWDCSQHEAEMRLMKGELP